MTKKAKDRDVIHDALNSDCLEAFDHVYAYINNELKDEEAIKQLEHHLRHCKSCFSRAQMERKINERLKKTSKPKVPKTLRKRVKNLIDNY
ncbi:MAG: zf-HC2 domain-containing protein [Candidatus Thiodiazotropha endolucinida]